MQNMAGILSLASLFFWGWYMDRFGSLPTVLVAVAINCMAPLVYAFAPSLVWLYLAAVSMGVSQSGIDLGYLNTTNDGDTAVGSGHRGRCAFSCWRSWASRPSAFSARRFCMTASMAAGWCVPPIR